MRDWACVSGSIRHLFWAQNLNIQHAAFLQTGFTVMWYYLKILNERNKATIILCRICSRKLPSEKQKSAPLRVVGPGRPIKVYIIYSAFIFIEVMGTKFLLLLQCSNLCVLTSSFSVFCSSSCLYSFPSLDKKVSAHYKKIVNIILN